MLSVGRKAQKADSSCSRIGRGSRFEATWVDVESNDDLIDRSSSGAAEWTDGGELGKGNTCVGRTETNGWLREDEGGVGESRR